jgi:DNA-binding transcriptional LysR family regulator
MNGRGKGGLALDLEVRPLRCFVAVAEEQSFSRAAERLRLTQPAVSAQIRELERLVGFDLFIRTTRRVELSDRGLAFFDYARRMIGETDRLKRIVLSLQKAEMTPLSVGAAFYTFDFPERITLFENFIAARTDIPLNAEMRWQSELLRDLDRGKLDLALIVGVPVGRQELKEITRQGKGSEGLFADDLKRLVLRRERVELLVPEESPLAQTNIIDPQMLKGQKIVMLTEAFGAPVIEPIMRLLDGAGATAFVPPEPSGIGVVRYGRQFRIPAIALGWFDDHVLAGAHMVKRAIAGFELETEFVLLGHNDFRRDSIEAFWEIAEKTFGARPQSSCSQDGIEERHYRPAPRSKDGRHSREVRH